MSNRSLRAAVPAALVLCALAGLARSAYAELGGSPMSPPADATTATLSPIAHAASSGQGASGGATATTTAPAAAYTVSATTYSTGTQVREYVDANGTVFGIAWNGPRMPDLQTLLGSYFPQYASAVKAERAALPGRRPVAVEQTDLVVHSGGHMGSFFGQAWLPSALPTGVTGADIK